MANKIKLSVAEPCHEDWEAMTPAEKGRFCDACQKQVVDFTSMSDTQIAAFFKKPSIGSVCGRFMNDQLDRDIIIPKKRIPWVKYFFQLTLPLFIASLKSNAQKKGGAAIDTVQLNQTYDAPLQGLIAIQPERVYSMTGKIINEEGDPVPYASIIIKNTKSGTQADSSGSFTLAFPVRKESAVLVVSSVGYTSQEIKVQRNEIVQPKNILVQLEKLALKEVVVVSYGVQGSLRVCYTTGSTTATTGKLVTTDSTSIWTKLSSFIRNTVAAVPKIYPNPVKSGATINVDCNKLEESYYSFALLTLSGQVIMQKEIWIDKEARVLNLPVPSVAAGTYLISLTSQKTGKNFTDKIIIQ